MTTIKLFFQDFFDFWKFFSRYLQKRGRQYWIVFEQNKNVLVDFLITKRGTNTRPFLHTSLIVFIVICIIALPVIANSYPSVAQEQLNAFTPPSAVLSSLDEPNTNTEVSDRVRDSVITYKVEQGDTLAKIAQKFDVSVDTIKWANSSLEDVDTVNIGQELQIPPVTGLVIKVKKGETIYSIAKTYKTDPQKILNYPFNDFTDLDTFALMAGQTLVVPDGVREEAAPVYLPQTIAQVGTKVGTGKFIWPTQGIITQNPVSYHMAVDIANPSAPPIMAADDGTVILVQYLRYDYGHHVMISHGNGYVTLYGHMTDIYVNVGDTVKRGQVIGKMGSTGRSTGTHLHFEIRKDGVLLNPLGFLN